ncbi:MAG: glutaminase A [Alphaproteobacteria bacterium]|nr:glutaminase A [Alphaproteobacteria bacterium]
MPRGDSPNERVADERTPAPAAIGVDADPSAPGGADFDTREDQLFKSLDLNNDNHVLRTELERSLARVGLGADDTRLSDSMAALNAYQRSLKGEAEEPVEISIPKAHFCKAVRHNIRLIERALQGGMVIPDFEDFAADIARIYDLTRTDRSGEAANYIPQLDLPQPDVDRYGVALCTIDGQRHAVGDSSTFFSVQSTCKPVNYSLALEEHGAEAVHTAVGYEPSGQSFNELTLDKRDCPHNPMINAGCIMSSAFISLTEKRAAMKDGSFSELEARGWSGKRFDYVMNRWQALCGGEKPRFSTSVYLSERQTADRNFALAYFMREKGIFPDGADLHDVLDFYFQCCAIEVNAEMMALVAATLANGGVCPTTGERVFSAETVRSCLSLMSSCGMYDASGEFAFTVGLPAKSGVSGAIMIVIPNVLGICTWSPRLDATGNSVRGIAFCRRLVETFNFHNYDNVTGVSGKKDPRLSRLQLQAIKVNDLIWAASKGDLGAIQDLLLRGADLGCADYDLRTPLHLAAAEGQGHIVDFFIRQSLEAGSRIDLNPKDRWGGTPLDDAYGHGHKAIIQMLETAGAVRGRNLLAVGGRVRAPAAALADPNKTTEMIWAASVGDLGALRRLVAQGVPLEIADYDLRTPLHLAAAEGHLAVVQFLRAHNVSPNPRDRWGYTPLADALRHGRQEVADFLKANGGTVPGSGTARAKGGNGTGRSANGRRSRPPVRRKA